MKKGSSETLKSLREEAESYFEREDYSLSLSFCEKIKEKYPKNSYGYFGVIKSKTNNYKKYVEEDVLKELKKDSEKLFELAKKSEKDGLKKEFDEYVDDCHEVEVLKKNKKEITSKEFLKLLHNDGISFINQNISIASSYNLSGKKIVNVYDLIKGLFLLTCLIFNIIYRNYLLIITIPFGIFGIITIYSFFNMNFIKKGKLISEKKYLEKIISDANTKTNDLKKEIDILDENITFLRNQKKSTISKIPETFTSQIEDLISDDEEFIGAEILENLSSNNMAGFTYLIDEKTNLEAPDVLLKLKPSLKEEDSELIKFINKKLSEKKNGQNEVLLMKNIKPYNYIIIGMLVVISILSIIVILNNFYEINFISFVFASITGVISTLIYNIKTGKHKSLIDTFNDNLLSCIFNASLVYNLVYMSITNELKFTYGFIEMPIIFILIFMGLVGIISLLKYKNLMIKLRGE